MDLQVVHVVVAGEIGGAERMLVDLAAAPLAHVHQAVVVFAPDEGLVRFFQEAGLDVIAGGRIRVHPLAEVWRAVGPTEVGRLTDILTARGARLVHLHTFRSHVLGARAAARVRARVIRTEHSTRVYTDPTCWPFSRWSLRRTARAVAVSRHVLATACRKAPWIASRMRVIPNGVDLTRFVPWRSTSWAMAWSDPLCNGWPAGWGWRTECTSSGTSPIRANTSLRPPPPSPAHERKGSASRCWRRWPWRDP